MGTLLLSRWSWSVHLVRGRPRRRFHVGSGGRPTDSSTWRSMAWCAGMLSGNLATCPNMALRPLVIRSDTSIVYCVLALYWYRVGWILISLFFIRSPFRPFPSLLFSPSPRKFSKEVWGALYKLPKLPSEKMTAGCKSGRGRNARGLRDLEEVGANAFHGSHGDGGCACVHTNASFQGRPQDFG